MTTDNRKYWLSWPLTALLVLLLAACGATVQTPDDTDGDRDPAPAGLVAGVVTGSTGEALANASVVVQESAAVPAKGLSVQSAATAFTNEYGEFAFDLDEAGAYTLTVTGEDEGAFVAFAVTETDGQLDAETLELEAAPYGIAMLPVQDAEGAAQARAVAYLAGTNHVGVTDNLGRVTLTRVPAGEYTAFAFTNDRNHSAGVTVVVKSGETTAADPVALRNTAPVITGITPFSILSNQTEQMLHVVITGENFGDTRGVSEVYVMELEEKRYSFEAEFGHVLKWSDTEIILRTDVYWGIDLDYLPEELADAAENAGRFLVATTSGESNPSERPDSAFLETYIYAYVHGPEVAMPMSLHFTGITNLPGFQAHTADMTITSDAATFSALEWEYIEYDPDIHWDYYSHQAVATFTAQATEEAFAEGGFVAHVNVDDAVAEIIDCDLIEFDYEVPEGDPTHRLDCQGRWSGF